PAGALALGGGRGRAPPGPRPPAGSRPPRGPLARPPGGAPRPAPPPLATGRRPPAFLSYRRETSDAFALPAAGRARRVVAGTPPSPALRLGVRDSAACCGLGRLCTMDPGVRAAGRCGCEAARRG